MIFVNSLEKNVYLFLLLFIYMYIYFLFFSFILFIYLSVFIPCHTIVAGYDGIMLVICMSVSLSVCPYFHFWTITGKFQWIFTKLGMPMDIGEICFGATDGQISSIFDTVICPGHVHIFVSAR